MDQSPTTAGEDAWPWLDDGPVFTTHGEMGGNVTRVPPGAALEPVVPGLPLLLLALTMSAAVTIAAFGLVPSSFAQGRGPSSWWWLALAIPAAALSFFFFAGVHVRGMELIMRERPRNFLLLAGTLAGVAVGLGGLAAWWAWRASDNGDQAHWTGLLGIWTFVAAVLSVAFLVPGVRGARRARRDIARILRLRATGNRQPGVVAGLPDPESWNDGGDVPIRIDGGAGPQELTVRLNTWAHEIPVPGTRVIVRTDGEGDILVEIDPDHPLEYHPDSQPYESDDSGGGSM